MNKRNYQTELDNLIGQQETDGRVPKLLLHSCCAPCSSYVLEYLSKYYKITVYYYNPNIYPPQEYANRLKEQTMLIEKMEFVHPVTILAGSYETEQFYQVTKGLEQEAEGGARCTMCYELRLREAAKVAKAGGFDYFTTSLSISPLKSSDQLNEIGERMEREYHIAYLPSDFKKRDGYKRSIALSQEYGLYRQNYCGCVYSIRT